MYHPTTRVLTVLELLQSHGEMTGPQIAQRLEINVRTVRRYIVMLQDMGIPVESERGRYGAYRLLPGFKLPPLMFTDEEVLALTLSLYVARQTSLNGAPVAIESVLAKIERVLPERLQSQMRDLQATMQMELATAPGVATSPAIIGTISAAVRLRQSVLMKHTAYNGTITDRTFDPYGLAYRVGRWYAVGFCHLRGDIRSFRLDRVLAIETTDNQFECPTDFDVMLHVDQALAATPGVHTVDVLFRSPLAEVTRYISAAVGRLTAEGDLTRLHCYVQQIGWFAGFLVGLPLPMVTVEPAALRHELTCILERVQATLGAG